MGGQEIDFFLVTNHFKAFGLYFTKRPFPSPQLTNFFPNIRDETFQTLAGTLHVTHRLKDL